VEGSSVEKLLKFRQYLQEQTNLSSSTIKLYCRTIARFLEKFEQTNEGMNAFVKQYSFNRFVLKHWLEFECRGEEYKALKGVKRKRVIREGVYIDSSLLKQIVFSIPNTMYRAVALIQYCTGARARDVLTIKSEWIEKVESDESIGLRIRMVQKGGRERIAFVPKGEFSDIVYNYVISAQKEYPFMRNCSEDFLTNVETNYHYYYNAIKQATITLGIPNFATHDFRRNFIDKAYTALKDIRVVKELVGHSQISTTLNYLRKHISETEARESIKKISF
jgi:integrase